MVRDMTLADALVVSLAMRKTDWDCIRAVTEITTREEFAVNRWHTTGAAYTLLLDGRPVAIAGVSQAVPWIGRFWMIATDEMTMQTWKKLLRGTRTVLKNAAKVMPRLEAEVLSTWTEAQDFAERVGFMPESVRCRAGRNGEDILIFTYQELLK